MRTLLLCAYGEVVYTPTERRREYSLQVSRYRECVHAVHSLLVCVVWCGVAG